MAITTTIRIVHNETAAQMVAVLFKASSANKEAAVQLQNYFKALAGGYRNAGVLMSVGDTGGTAATGTLTNTGQPTAAQTVTINGVVFTVVALGAGALNNQFALGASAAATYLNLVNAINASTTPGIRYFVSAVQTSGTVVTITSNAKGLSANAIGLSTTCTNLTASAANLASGTEPTFTTYQLGL